MVSLRSDNGRRNVRFCLGNNWGTVGSKQGHFGLNTGLIVRCKLLNPNNRTWDSSTY